MFRFGRLKEKKEEENFVSLPFFLFSLCRPVVRYSGGDAATLLASASAHTEGRLSSPSQGTEEGEGAGGAGPSLPPSSRRSSPRVRDATTASISSTQLIAALWADSPSRTPSSATAIRPRSRATGGRAGARDGPEAAIRREAPPGYRRGPLALFGDVNRARNRRVAPGSGRGKGCLRPRPGVLVFFVLFRK